MEFHTSVKIREEKKDGSVRGSGKSCGRKRNVLKYNKRRRKEAVRMKKAVAAILIMVCFLGLAGCGSGRKNGSGGSTQASGKKSSVVEVRMTMDNFFDYFEYHEFRSPTKNDNGDTTSMQILYGYKLKDG